MIKHRWDISPDAAIKLQKALAHKVQLCPLTGDVRAVAGVDCAFLDGGKKILAVAVLCDAHSMEVVASACDVQQCKMPYIPGLLSFREAPAVISAVIKLGRRIDLLMCDGQGLAHPRGLGLASHVGLWLDIPTIGVAKSRLCGQSSMPASSRGCRRQLRLNGKLIGYVLRTRAAVKPLYISPGHRITFDEAASWTLRCCRGVRLPEPTRRAHQYVTKMKENESFRTDV